MAIKTISAESLLSAYNGKYKYVTMNKDQRVHFWKYKPDNIRGYWHWDIPGEGMCIGKIAITEFQDRTWDLCIYKAKPSEEDWIGTLCFFAMNKEDLKIGTSRLGILKNINRVKKYNAVGENNMAWPYCRPVRPDEIKFFNDDTEEE